jgi:hypothetical protein
VQDAGNPDLFFFDHLAWNIQDMDTLGKMTQGLCVL